MYFTYTVSQTSRHMIGSHLQTDRQVENRLLPSRFSSKFEVNSLFWCLADYRITIRILSGRNATLETDHLNKELKQSGF